MFKEDLEKLIVSIFDKEKFFKLVKEMCKLDEI